MSDKLVIYSLSGGILIPDWTPEEQADWEMAGRSAEDIQIRHIPAETPTWQCGRCRCRFRAAPTGEVLCPECGKQMIAFEGLGPR